MKGYQEKDANNPIASLVADALQSVKSFVDMDTIIGSAINMGEGVVAYPIIKVTVGLVSGGGQYANKIIVRKTGSCYPFAGGTGAGFTAEPMGFLIVNKGEHQLITMQNKNAWASVMSKIGDGLSEYLKSLAKKEIKKTKKGD